jgi:tripartite-type tricarboxylate transporter receptor subunit TctC
VCFSNALKTFHHRDPFEAQIMKLPHRRQFLHLAAGAAALPAVSRVARAQTYPTRPVRFIVGIAAGGTQDIAGRLIAQRLSERLGQQFVVENRVGAASNIATEAVAHAPPDGYTLYLANTANAINATLYDKLSFNFVSDIAPVASIARTPGVMEVHPLFPAKTVPEFIAHAKAHPGKVNMASAGNGNVTHMWGELFKLTAGVNLQHVPYRGEAPAITDLLGGQVDVLFGGLPAAVEHIRAGRLRALAVTTAARSQALPDTPIIGDFVSGYEASAWYGIGAPRNTSAEIIDKLNREINLSLADPQVVARFAELGFTALAGSPAEFGKLVADETEKWARVVRATGAKAD